MQNLEQKLKPKTHTKIRKGSRSAVSSFIAKTYEILEDAHFPDIIDWNDEGTAIIIKKPQEFAQQVLSVYFKHRNLTSFVRQLNMYNFRKQRTQKVEHVYCHELFQRDKKYLLEQIKRKNQEQFLPESDPQETGEELEPSSDLNLDISTLVQEKQALKRFNTQASIKINCLEGKVKDLTIQNQTLKDQLQQQSERDKILISLMANILKNYGIPPSELSYIMNPDSKQIQFQHNLDDELSFGSPQMESDVAQFFNFDNEVGIAKAASTVLNNKVNFEAARDITPSSVMKPDSFSNWDSAPPIKYLNKCPNPNENGVFYMNNGGSWNRLRYPMESNLGKRAFEEEKEFGLVQDSFENLTKKIEFNPSVKKMMEIYPNNNPMNQTWPKSKEIEEATYKLDFLNFKPTM